MALKPVDLVQTLPLVETGVGGALVNVNLALGAVGSRRAVTLKIYKLEFGYNFKGLGETDSKRKPIIRF